MSSPILTLAAAKRYRENRGLTPKQLAAITTIPVKRVKVLESLNVHLAEEPWMDEARAIGRALGVEGVLPLLGAASLDVLDLGFDLNDDLDCWRTGCRLPLAMACRLALRFGLSDPFELYHREPIYRQIWSTVATGERTPAPGTCPWCMATIVGDAGHLDTCLPANLWGPRDQPILSLGVPPRPRKPGRRRFGSKAAPGLQAFRESRGTTQDTFAASIGLHPNYYARLEQGRDKLTLEMADKIGALYKIDPMILYAPPAADAAEVSGSLT